jgi:putative serine/threonine protein kinase
MQLLGPLKFNSELLCGEKMVYRIPGDIICYPAPTSDCVNERIECLRKLGVIEYISAGAYNIGKWRVLGKGHSAIVFLAITESREFVAVKARRIDSKRESLIYECKLLKEAYPVSPKVYDCNDDLIIMEFIPGITLGEYIEKRSDCENIVNMFIKLMIIVAELDRLGIEHSELSNPEKHVIIGCNNEIKVVDFESAKHSLKSCNVCDIVSWFMFRCNRFQKVCRVTDHLRNEIIDQIRQYKGEVKRDTLINIINLISILPK